MFSPPLPPQHRYFLLAHDYQRDLLWSVFGPALLDCPWSPAEPAWLQQSPISHWPDWADHIPRPAPFRSSRLGLMFEQIWHQYFDQQAIHWQANLQVQQDKRTLGELDLLIQHGQQPWHLELALKFYLGFGNDWIGPNRRDYLADKIRHTRDKQLALSQHPAARRLLAQYGWHQIQPQALMRGCLFHPANPEIEALLPAEVNPQHWRGLWLHQADARQLLPDSRWYLLAKPQWLSPARVPFSVDRSRLLQHIDIHFRHLNGALCAVEVAQNPAGHWCEQQRWLIMPDHWPQIAG